VLDVAIVLLLVLLAPFVDIGTRLVHAETTRPSTVLRHELVVSRVVATMFLPLAARRSVVFALLSIIVVVVVVVVVVVAAAAAAAALVVEGFV